MLTRIVVLSDTHLRSPDRLPAGILRAVRDADYVVHCGDYTGVAVLEELQRLAKNFVGVYGNVDPAEIRRRLPAKATFEVNGRKIGVIHPHWGGYPVGIEEEIRAQFHNVDAILFGHTHDPVISRHGPVLLLNPGQGYPSFLSPASMGILTVTNGKMEPAILTAI